MHRLILHKFFTSFIQKPLTFQKNNNILANVNARSIGDFCVFTVKTLSLRLGSGQSNNFKVLLPAGKISNETQVLLTIIDIGDIGPDKEGTPTGTGTPFVYVDQINHGGSIPDLDIVVKNLGTRDSLNGAITFHISLLQ